MNAEKKHLSTTTRLSRQLNYRQQRACQLRASGISQAQSYVMAGYRCKKKESTDVAASQLFAKPHIKQYLNELREHVFKANAMTATERRDFLARAVRTPVAEVNATSDLAQDVEYSLDKEGNPYVTKIKVPNKLAALELDAKLAGDLNPDTQVNVGIQLINERIKRVEKAYIPEDVV